MAIDKIVSCKIYLSFYSGGSSLREFTIPTLLGSNSSNLSKFTIPSLLSSKTSTGSPTKLGSSDYSASPSRLESIADLHLTSSSENSTPNLNSLANLHLSSNPTVSLLGATNTSPWPPGQLSSPSPVLAHTSVKGLADDIDLTSALKSVQPSPSEFLVQSPELIKPDTVLLLVDLNNIKSNLREQTPSSFGKVVNKR